MLDNLINQEDDFFCFCGAGAIFGLLGCIKPLGYLFTTTPPLLHLEPPFNASTAIIKIKNNISIG